MPLAVTQKHGALHRSRAQPEPQLEAAAPRPRRRSAARRASRTLFGGGLPAPQPSAVGPRLNRHQRPLPWNWSRWHCPMLPIALPDAREGCPLTPAFASLSKWTGCSLPLFAVFSLFSISAFKFLKIILRAFWRSPGALNIFIIAVALIARRFLSVSPCQLRSTSRLRSTSQHKGYHLASRQLALDANSKRPRSFCKTLRRANHLDQATTSHSPLRPTNCPQLQSMTFLRQRRSELGTEQRRSMRLPLDLWILGRARATVQALMPEASNKLRRLVPP
mmetsp:Transcript_99705/g.179955  ORF Transcript_99705/g.179955 Transcript_99705/m.179955 type:complete len:277 (+) Transcript_99705:285-1115(+)